MGCLRDSVREGDSYVHRRRSLPEERAVVNRGKPRDGILGDAPNLRLAGRHQSKPPVGVAPDEHGGILLGRDGRVRLLNPPPEVGDGGLEDLVRVRRDRDLVAHPDGAEAYRPGSADRHERVDQELVHERLGLCPLAGVHHNFLIARNLADLLRGLASTSASEGMTGRRVSASARRTRRSCGVASSELSGWPLILRKNCFTRRSSSEWKLIAQRTPPGLSLPNAAGRARSIAPSSSLTAILIP